MAEKHDFWFNMGKLLLAAFLFVGYYLLIAGAMWVAIPAGSAQFVSSGIAVLGPIIGVVANNMWPKGSQQDKDTITALTQKVPPVTVPAADLTENQVGQGQK